MSEMQEAHLRALADAYATVKGEAPPSMDLDAELRDDLDLDSLDLIEVGMILEDSGAQSLEAKDAESIQTVRDVLELFESSSD